MTRASDDADVDENSAGLLGQITVSLKRALLYPVRPFISSTAIKAYLATVLLVSTAFVLLGCAVAAYVLFYWSYVPRVSFSRTIHLQFDSVYTNAAEPSHPPPSPFPYGSASLSPDLVAAQAYDVWIELSMPRTPDNQDAGNFMLSVRMSGPPGRVDPPVATSRRPAILPYRPLPLDLLHHAVSVPWDLLGLRSSSSSSHHTLRIPVFESVTFLPRRSAASSSPLPTTLDLELQSTHRLQIYSARAVFRARLRGLRSLLHHHPILAAGFFVPAFWCTELLFAGLSWLALSAFLAPSPPAQQQQEQQADAVARAIKREAGLDSDVKIKPEPDDAPPQLSDTERSFPTLRGQQPLLFRPGSLRSEQHYGGISPQSHAPLVEQEMAADAAEEEGDEGEDDDFVVSNSGSALVDSGIGTSLESSGPGRALRRRTGRNRNRRKESPGNAGGNVWRDDEDDDDDDDDDDDGEDADKDAAGEVSTRT